MVAMSPAAPRMAGVVMALAVPEVAPSRWPPRMRAGGAAAPLPLPAVGSRMRTDSVVATSPGSYGDAFASRLDSPGRCGWAAAESSALMTEPMKAPAIRPTPRAR
jgi:hypothetical protein